MVNNLTQKVYSSKLKAQSLNNGGALPLELSAFSFQLFAAAAGTPESSNRDDISAGDPSNRPLRIVIAGGGTGGHLFPGIAIAREFEVRNSATRVIFVSTGNLMEKSVLSKNDYELRCVAAAGIKGRGVWNQLLSAMKIPKGIFQSIRILKDFSPDLALGLGSYSAGPVIIAAWLRRVPIVIHEQNILPGITNRILARFAGRIYISFKNTSSNLDQTKVKWTGNPVRNELLEYADALTPEKNDESGNKIFNVLIIGGSQGAHAINMAVIKALDSLESREYLHFVHQTGEADELQVREAYRSHKIPCTVQPFFDNMAELYHRADLLICRAGATTVAEITALGKVAIFIPFPYAADNHQALNAGMLADEGAAEMIIESDLNAEILSRKLGYYASHREALKKMGAKARQFGNPDAAANIVNDCYALVDGFSGGSGSQQ